MDQQQVHFEVFARRPGGSFTLQLAVEDRDQAIEAAEEMLEGGKFTAVKVCKETLDPENGEYKTISIFNKGTEERPKSKVELEDRGPLCVSPQDFYNVHARDRIGRLLENWLMRQRATPWELLHRADLIEKLEAAGNDLQHAVQKISVPEAQARGVSVHEVIRGFQTVIQRAIDRVLADQRKGRFPNLTKENFAAACERLGGDPERQYFVGAGVANFIAPAKTWAEKVDLLLDLADAAPAQGPGRGLAFFVLEQPLSEILGSRVGLNDLLGGELDLGGNLAALTRLAAAQALELLARHDASIVRFIPPLSGPAERLARWLESPAFEGVRLALSKRILAELGTSRRLRPSDPRGEIDIMRALAMALTTASGKLLPLEEVREAFIDRSKMLVTSEFVSAYLAAERPALEEAQDLLWLMENVTGPQNKRQAGRWLLSTITSLKFDTEFNASADSAPVKLQRLAKLHRDVARAGGDAGGHGEVLQKLSEMGAKIEADAKLTPALVRAKAPLAQKLGALLKMAVGDTAPPGPAADRAKAEAMKLIRAPGAINELAQTPEALMQVKTLMQALEAA